MNNLKAADWYRSTGALRVSLLSAAVLCKILLYIFNPPYYLSKEALILPFPFLLALDAANVVMSGIIIIECIRIIAHRATTAWSLQKHFVILSVLIVALVVFNVMLVSPRKSIRYYNYGWSLIPSKDYKKAISSLTIAIKYNAKNTKAYLERGYSHRELNDLASALNDYDKVLEIDSKNASAYEGKGYVHYFKGDCPSALREWQTALDLDPARSIKLEKWLKNCKQKLKKC